MDDWALDIGPMFTGIFELYNLSRVSSWGQPLAVKQKNKFKVSHKMAGILTISREGHHPFIKTFDRLNSQQRGHLNRKITVRFKLSNRHRCDPLLIQIIFVLQIIKRLLYGNLLQDTLWNSYRITMQHTTITGRPSHYRLDEILFLLSLTEESKLLLLWLWLWLLLLLLLLLLSSYYRFLFWHNSLRQF